MKNLFNILMLLLLGGFSFAQPANDNCTGAITLTPSPVCNTVLGTTLGATQSAPGCTGNANDDVWYTFTATSTGHSISVSGNGNFNPVLQIFTGPCLVGAIQCINATAGGGTELYNATNFNVGSQYYIRVYDFNAGAPVDPTFNICVSSNITEPPCDANSPEPANSIIPCVNVPKICRVNGFCGTTQGYHATPVATNLTPYTDISWANLDAAFCGSIENNSFMQFTASASTVQLRIYGSCTTGTGIQMLAFSLDSGVCGTGNVTSYGCFSPLNLNTVPTTGLPMTFTGMVPGQTYYLMVDGFAGAICDYKIGADFGVQVSAYVTPNVSDICLGTSVPLAAGGGNGVYDWDPEPTLSGVSGPLLTATPTALGTYTYVMNSLSTDSTCPANADTATINVYAPPTPNAGVDDTVCFSLSGSVINLTGIGSNPINTLEWEMIPPVGTTPSIIYAPSSSSPITAAIVNLPGLYKFVLKETNPTCGIYRDTVEMFVSSHQQSVSFVAPSCAGGNDGTVTVTNPDAVDYSFDNGTTWQLASTGGGFTAGIFPIRSRNSAGCEVSSSVVIVDPPAVTISVSNDTLICENGTATVVAIGANGTNFTFNWSANANTTTNSGTQMISPAVPDYYYVTGTSAEGCVTPLDSIYIDLNPALNGNVSPDSIICPGDNIILTSNAMGGNGGPYTHTWSTTTIGNGPSHSITESPALTTVYSVEISDACETTPIILTSTVTVAPVPQPSFDVVVDSMCAPGIFTVFSTTDPTTVSSSQWLLSDGQSYINLDTIISGEMSAGTYDVTLTVTSPNGCLSSHTENAFLVSMAIPNSNFRYSPEVVTAFSTEVSFNNLSSGNNYNFWTFEDADPAASSLTNPTVTFPEGIPENYYVELIVQSEFGCLDTSYQIVKVIPEVILFAPNSFTPDDDEHNGTWSVVIEGIDISSFELVIYDRWGETVWINNDPSATWDGTFKGKLMPTGMYNWKLRAKDAENDNVYNWTGHINLLK